jgi:hypothetical protein
MSREVMMGVSGMSSTTIDGISGKIRDNSQSVNRNRS